MTHRLVFTALYLRNLFSFGWSHPHAVAATRMDLLNIDAPFDELLHVIINTAHSRFPVYQGERENIIGILETTTTTVHSLMSKTVIFCFFFCIS